MREVDELLRALETPPAPPEAPRWPVGQRSRVLRRWPVAAGLALAAALLVFVLVPRDPAGPEGGSAGVRLRGGADGVVALDLRMVVERGGVAVRVSAGQPVRVGERVLFRGSADRPTEAILWVDGPAGRERITEVPLDPVPRDLGDARGLVGYRFDGPGRYVFALEPASGTCDPCPTLPVEVR